MMSVAALNNLWFRYVTVFTVGFLLAVGCQSPPVRPPKPLPSVISTPVSVELRHPGVNSNAALPYDLIQRFTGDGDVLGYSLEVDSVFCQEDLCSVVPVTLHWDALGVFESLSLNEGVELEKVWKDTSGFKVEYKAVPFNEEDYQKLNRILSDENSLLKKQKAESLLEGRKKAKLELDAVSGATPLALSDAVVEGGAITCFHLWHWANGDVKAVARGLTHQRCNQQTLIRFLKSEKEHYVQFALEHLVIHKLFAPEIITNVNAVMHGAEKETFALGYTYLNAAIPDNDAFMKNLAGEFSKFSPAARVVLLTRLDAEKSITPSALGAMAETLPKMERYYEVHLFLNLLNRHKYASPAALKQVLALLDKPNFFISRRAYTFLKKQTLDSGSADRLQQFRQKSEREGRILE